MSEVSHSEILQRVSVVETKLERLRQDFDVEKDRAAEARDSINAKLTDIHAEILRRSAVRAAAVKVGKGAVMVAAFGASVAAMLKGFNIFGRN